MKRPTEPSERMLKILKDMLYEESNPNTLNYGATLSHWRIDGVVDIDAGGLRALIRYYEDLWGM